MTVNADKFFNELLPAAMLEKPEYFKEIGFDYTFNISGEGGGEWSVKASNSGPSVTQGNPGNSNCTIIMSVEDFQQIYQNPMDIVQLFFMGKLKSSGDPMGLAKVPKIFNLGK